MKTQTIANQEITLLEGTRYFASRPMATRKKISQQRFTVTIIKRSIGWNNFYSRSDEVAIPDLTYDQANAFLKEFNNESCSLSGRIW